MKTFNYRCKSLAGALCSGQLVAETSRSAERELFSRDLYILSIEEYVEKKTAADSLFQHIRLKDLCLFTRQLGRLLHAGLSLPGAIDTVRDQTASKPLAALLAKVSTQVKSGNTLHNVLGQYPKAFSPDYVSLIRAGEMGGILEDTLRRLSDYLETEVGNRSRVVNALIYPATMLAVGILTVFVLMSFVIPRFVVVFEQMNQDLPLITQALINVSGFMQAYWWAVVMGALAASLLCKACIALPSVREFADGFALKMPVIGNVVKKSEIARFVRTLGTLLESGIPMLAAIDSAAKTLTNTLFRRELKSAYARIQDGENLSTQLHQSPLFPSVVANIVAVAERSGTLDRALQEIADDYDNETGRDVKVMLTLLEPALIVFVGGLVGAIVIGMLLPIFSLEEMMQ